MKKLFLMSVAAATLVGASGVAIAQAPNEKSNSPATQSAPTEKAAPAEKPVPQMNHNEAPAAKSNGGMNGGRADQARPPAKGDIQHTQEIGKDAAPSRAQSEQNPEMKHTGKSSADMKANGQPASEKSASEMNAGKPNSDKVEFKSTAENEASRDDRPGRRRIKATTHCRAAHVDPRRHQRAARSSGADVNFSISIGTRVPRTVSFLPAAEPADIDLSGLARLRVLPRRRPDHRRESSHV